MLRKLMIPVAVLCLMAISSTGLLHSLVPHQHAHDAKTTASSIWSSLHQAIQHGQKKFLTSLSETLSILLIVLVGTRLMSVSIPSLVLEPVRIDPHRGRDLHKGIRADRRFR